MRHPPDRTSSWSIGAPVGESTGAWVNASAFGDVRCGYPLDRLAKLEAGVVADVSSAAIGGPR